MINIQELILFMRNGWVAMDKNGEWWWFKDKPTLKYCVWSSNEIDVVNLQALFNIAPVDDWKKSLIHVDELLNEIK